MNLHPSQGDFDTTPNRKPDTQRKRLIQILQELIDQLKMEEVAEEVAEKPIPAPTTLYHRI
jgi:Fe2+ or Zn2+ uptake regulation protein